MEKWLTWLALVVLGFLSVASIVSANGQDALLKAHIAEENQVNLMLSVLAAHEPGTVTFLTSDPAVLALGAKNKLPVMAEGSITTVNGRSANTGQMEGPRTMGKDLGTVFWFYDPNGNLLGSYTSNPSFAYAYIYLGNELPSCVYANADLNFNYLPTITIKETTTPSLECVAVAEVAP